jgi:hypothetical protein
MREGDWCLILQVESYLKEHKGYMPDTGKDIFLK